MGFIKKILTGNKSFYKLHVQCNENAHSKVIIISSKEKDLDTKIKNKDTELIKKILGEEYCDKCVFNVDKLGDDTNIKKAKKIYSSIELK